MTRSDRMLYTCLPAQPSGDETDPTDGRADTGAGFWLWYEGGYHEFHGLADAAEPDEVARRLRAEAVAKVAVDPVSLNFVRKRTSVVTEYCGRRFYFESESDRRTFEDDPERYLEHWV